MLCDLPVYETLTAGTIETLDNALEQVFNLEEVSRGNDWEALIYVYGYFNRDVTPEEIGAVAERWRGTPVENREPDYPTYIHVIDAVCKPLSMGPLSGGGTVEALEIALPLLIEGLTQAPQPGRAFHPPSHAALVLCPLYDRWPQQTPEGAVVRKHLGNREVFIRRVGDQLVGTQANPAELPDYAYGFYAYSGRYIANALARMDARSARPVLRASLEVYQDKGASDSTVTYTRRALVALGDAVERKAFEADLADSARHEGAVAQLVWLTRNGGTETRAYAGQLLGSALECDAGTALETWFERQLPAEE